MNKFDLSQINKTLSDQKSRSQTLLKNTMASSKFESRNSKGEFNSTIDNDLSGLKRTKSEIIAKGKLIESRKFDTG